MKKPTQKYSPDLIKFGETKYVGVKQPIIPNPENNYPVLEFGKTRKIKRKK